MKRLKFISIGLASFLVLALLAFAPSVPASTAQEIGTSTITGTVTDATSGAAIANLRVFAKTEAFRKSAVTDGAGKYTLEKVPAGTYAVTASVRNYRPETKKDVVVKAGETVTVNFALTAWANLPSGTITGTVTDATSNAPIANLRVFAVTEAFRKGVTTDVAGKYTLEKVPAGTYVLTASARNYRPETKKDIVLEAGKTVAVNFALTAWADLPSGTITGTVTDATSGAALTNVRVFAVTGAFRKSAITDVAGKYTLEKAPAGTYVLTASTRDYRPETKKDIVVKAGETVTVNSALTAWANLPSGTITGFVKDATGAPIAKARVSARMGAFRKGAITDEAGKYTLEKVPAGTYVLTASARRYSPETKKDIVVEAGKTITADFALKPGWSGRWFARGSHTWTWGTSDFALKPGLPRQGAARELRGGSGEGRQHPANGLMRPSAPSYYDNVLSHPGLRGPLGLASKAEGFRERK